MNTDTLKKICLLIEERMGKYKKPLTQETTLERDLGITGDDAVELLIEYGERFKVDLSNFNVKEYFYPEGDSILPAFIRLFTGKKNPKKKELTLGDLERAVKIGKL